LQEYSSFLFSQAISVEASAFQFFIVIVLQPSVATSQIHHSALSNSSTVLYFFTSKFSSEAFTFENTQNVVVATIIAVATFNIFFFIIQKLFIKI
jgi:hypothetical protein